MTFLKKIQSNEVLNNTTSANIKGGKRFVAANLSSSERLLIQTAEKKASKTLGSNSGSFSFSMFSEQFNVEVDMGTHMLHLTGQNGEDFCVEW
jgi:hypothetical protein